MVGYKQGLRYPNMKLLLIIASYPYPKAILSMNPQVGAEDNASRREIPA